MFEILAKINWKDKDEQVIYDRCFDHLKLSDLLFIKNNMQIIANKLYDILIKNYPTLQQQYKVEWCKKKTYLPFDFVIPEYNIIIELDGPQHFIQISNWSSPKEQQINDKYKMDCANKNNYSVIRLTQEDVFYDTYDWLSELNDNIKDIIKNKKVQNIFMCKDNEYDIFN